MLIFLHGTDHNSLVFDRAAFKHYSHSIGSPVTLLAQSRIREQGLCSLNAGPVLDSATSKAKTWAETKGYSVTELNASTNSTVLLSVKVALGQEVYDNAVKALLVYPEVDDELCANLFEHASSECVAGCIDLLLSQNDSWLLCRVFRHRTDLLNHVRDEAFITKLLQNKTPFVEETIAHSYGCLARIIADAESYSTRLYLLAIYFSLGTSIHYTPREGGTLVDRYMITADTKVSSLPNPEDPLCILGGPEWNHCMLFRVSEIRRLRRHPKTAENIQAHDYVVLTGPEQYVLQLLYEDLNQSTPR